MTYSRWLILILLLSLVAGDRDKLNDAAFANLIQISKGIHNFSYSFLIRSVVKFEGTNFAVSPFAIWVALAALTEGTNDLTQGELYAVLGYKGVPPIKPISVVVQLIPFLLMTSNVIEHEVVNALYYENFTINQKFLNAVSGVYRTHVRSTNFSNKSALANINNLLDLVTHGRIMDALEQEDLEDARMIFINAMFFRAQWSIPFNESNTFVATFYDEEKNVKGEVNMMNLRAVLPYAYLSQFKAHVVQLPYGMLNRLSMIVMVPRSGTTIKEMIQHFTTVPVTVIFDALLSSAENLDTVVDVYLPRFKLVTKIVLNELLAGMGAYDIFDPVYANFSGMSPTEGLYLSKIIHKTRLEVTEQGLEMPIIKDTNLNDKDTLVTFNANKPFLYFVVERISSIVGFGGVYTEPSLY